MSNKVATLATKDNPAAPAVMKETLRESVKDMPEIHEAGALPMACVLGLGVKGWPELAMKLYALAQDQGVLDRCFPLSAVSEDRGNEAQAISEG